MERQEIIAQVTSYVQQSIEGSEMENSKIDFKRDWYNLKEEKGINEFLKDSTAMANTFGPDGFIIIGFDDKSKQLKNATFKDSGLNDTSNLIDLINKRVDRLFQLDVIEEKILQNTLSIIHIPPSFDKPHIIRQYKSFKGDIVKSDEQRVLVRSGTTIRYATKNDFELMYWDRKNVVPEYLVYSSIPRNSISFFAKLFRGFEEQNFRVAIMKDLTEFIKVSFKLQIEHAGSRSIGLTNYRISFIAPKGASKDVIEVEGTFQNEITLKAGDIAMINVEWVSTVQASYKEQNQRCEFFQQQKSVLKSTVIIYETMYGEEISSDVKYIGN